MKKIERAGAAFACSVLLLLAGSAAISTTAAAQPANLKDAKLTTRAVAAGALEKELLAERAGEPHWVAYAVPAAEKGNVCCFSDLRFHGQSSFCCGGCNLETEGSFVQSKGEAGTLQLEGRSQLLVFHRMANGRVTNVRVFSADCALDAAGRPVVWLTGVSPDESVASLGSLVDAGTPRDSKASKVKRGRRSQDDEDDDDAYDEDGLSDRALTAISMHAGAAADKALERFLARDRPLGLRKKAAFWLGNSRGRAGFETLKRIAPDDPSEAFRHHATFAFSQSSVPEATDTLLTMARRDPAGDVRGQALFWLAQKASDKAVGAIENALRDDPDAEVKEQAVFALSQLPKDQGIPQLIKLAKTHRTPEVREKAIFWLGQSRDPRALDYIEQLLTR